MKKLLIWTVLSAFLFCSGFTSNITDTSLESFGSEDNHSKVILVGDSRFWHLHEYTHDSGFSYLTGPGKGLSWFVNYGVPALDADVKGKTIIFNVGINDITACKNMSEFEDLLIRYREMLSVLVSRWPKTKIVLASVMPLGDQSKENFREYNEKIIVPFNEMLRDINGTEYMDLQEFFKNDTYTFLSEYDGYHYSPDTNIRLDKFIREHAQQKRWLTF